MALSAGGSPTIVIGGPLPVVLALLNRKSQALHATEHVRVAGGDPDPDAAHRRLRSNQPVRPLRSSRTSCSASVSTSHHGQLAPIAAELDLDYSVFRPLYAAQQEKTAAAAYTLMPEPA